MFVPHRHRHTHSDTHPHSHTHARTFTHSLIAYFSARDPDEGVDEAAGR